MNQPEPELSPLLYDKDAWEMDQRLGDETNPEITMALFPRIRAWLESRPVLGWLINHPIIFLGGLAAIGAGVGLLVWLL